MNETIKQGNKVNIKINLFLKRLDIARQKKAREELEEQSALEYGERILGLQEEVEGERRARFRIPLYYL